MSYSALGVVMSPNVPKYFPSEAQQWTQIPADIQSQINAQANLIYKNQQSQITYMQAEGACDATKSGRLAGGLKAMLIQAGGDPSRLSSAADVFGALECAEWWKVFGRAVTMEDAVAVAKGTGGAALAVICPKGATVPSCPKPAPALPPPVAPPPVAPPVVPVPVQPKKANMLVVGGVAAAVAGGGYLLAKKKGWIKS
jgi:hypothetical protein